MWHQSFRKSVRRHQGTGIKKECLFTLSASHTFISKCSHIIHLKVSETQLTASPLGAPAATSVTLTTSQVSPCSASWTCVTGDVCIKVHRLFYPLPSSRIFCRIRVRTIRLFPPSDHQAAEQQLHLFLIIQKWQRISRCMFNTAHLQTLSSIVCIMIPERKSSFNISGDPVRCR